MLIAGFTYVKGGWLIVGQYAFCYLLIWFAIKATKLKNWDKHGDFSYGIYIIAWPLMQFSAYFGLEKAGWLVYHLVIVAGCHAYAYLSWHLIERPALQLKDWTPKWLASTLASHGPPAGRRHGLARPESRGSRRPRVRRCLTAPRRRSGRVGCPGRPRASSRRRGSASTAEGSA